ncbi:hypothetical protein PVK06_009276 [Gossypium arboreum]|uniref:DUF4283 domain-containing protein n=1 Tax=Gossypium arboreum TaxID=29729 RepID=A0ABR0QN82_GOSAR|nr:hypothetical protein PVK06_009276 [Gossypium arboreum]
MSLLQGTSLLRNPVWGKNLFKLKLMANVGNKIGATEVVMVSDDLEIIEDGIRVSLEGLYPETFFLDWVQKILDKSMDLTVVVRLLGRTTGYKTLLNIIQTLWKHVGSFQVIDRDNDYYLVKFTLSQDYTKA